MFYSICYERPVETNYPYRYVSFAWKDPQNIVEEINKLQ